MAKPKRGNGKAPILKVDGKPLDLNRLSPSVLHIKEFLDGLRDDDLLTTVELAKGMVRSQWTVEKYGGDPALADYCHVYQHRKHWGNPRAIAEFRRQTRRPA